jgi:hypothetical protein
MKPLEWLLCALVVTGAVLLAIVSWFVGLMAKN